MRILRLFRLFFLVCMAVACAAAVFVVCINVWMVLSTRSLIFTRPEDVAAKQAVLVPGTRVYAGEVSSVLRDRLISALALYRTKKVRRILVSGDHGGKYYDEVNAMRRYLLAAGVPAGDIVMDHAGFSTFDSLYRARDVFGVRSLVIATQGFHLPRALYLARHLGIDAVGFRTEEESLSESVLVRNALREPFARVKAWWDILTGAKPAVLGPPIPLEGGQPRDERMKVSAIPRLAA